MKDLTILTNNNIVKNGYAFVDLFFIISGFVIYHNYKDNIISISDGTNFLKRRLKRLIPLHLFTLFLILFKDLSKYIYLLINPNNFETLGLENNNFKVDFLQSFLPQLFLVNSTPFFHDFSWNGQNWSISAEIISYFLFTILIILIPSDKKFKNVSISIIIFGFLFFYITYGNFNILQDFHYSFIRGFIGFFFGILIYSIKNIISIKKNKTVVFSILEFLVLIITLFIIYQLKTLINYYYLSILSFGLTVLIFSCEKGIISKFLKNKFFISIGIWSYSIYLNHTLINKFCHFLFRKNLKISDSNYIFFELITLVILIVYSKYTYQFIEKRFYKSKYLK
ncbi:acyltransferase family protein [Urechidicola croceus]